jgi:hypothetical protein
MTFTSSLSSIKEITNSKWKVPEEDEHIFRVRSTVSLIVLEESEA